MMPDREKTISDLSSLREHYAFYESELKTIDDAIELLTMIKEPDCRICGQSHCRYYHESRKPPECRSYICMEGR